MSELILILTVLGIHITAWLTPGPTFLLIVRNVFIYKANAYIWNALGIFFSNIIHTSYAIMLLLSISHVSENIMISFQICGGLYLIYLGYRTIFSKQPDDSISTKEMKIPTFQVFREAFFTNLLSPKASLFFLSIFSMVVSKNVSSWVLYFLWIGLPINSFIMANAIGYIFSRPAVQGVYAQYPRVIHGTLGLIMIFLGISLILI